MALEIYEEKGVDVAQKAEPKPPFLPSSLPSSLPPSLHNPTNHTPLTQTPTLLSEPQNPNPRTKPTPHPFHLFFSNRADGTNIISNLPSPLETPRIARRSLQQKKGSRWRYFPKQPSTTAGSSLGKRERDILL